MKFVMIWSINVSEVLVTLLGPGVNDYQTKLSLSNIDTGGGLQIDIKITSNQ